MPILKHKIVFLGDQSVGKTSIITRFIYDSFEGSKTVLSGAPAILLLIKRAFRKVDFIMNGRKL